METITKILSEYIVFITVYAISATFITIMVITNKVLSRKKLMKWKSFKTYGEISRNFKFGFVKVWEPNNDELLEELFEENNRLETELKILNKEYTKLSILAWLIILPTIIRNIFRNKDNKNTINTSQSGILNRDKTGTKPPYFNNF